jgi:hypothetical protein
MAITTTGSLVLGCVDGLADSLVASGTYGGTTPRVTFVVGTPDGLLTSVTGSDLAFNIADGKFYIGDITNGAGGSAWTALRTV